jgi:GT2 family glycosyltransferase
VKSSIRPDLVVIVSSGSDIRNLIKSFSDALCIRHIHTSGRGQALQKKLGIAEVDKSIEWVLFSDDDLVFENDTFSNLNNYLTSRESSNVVGIGLSLPPTARSIHQSTIIRNLGRIFLLDSKRAGVVLKSGHATSYLQLTNPQEVQWLNGASMWRSEYAQTYGHDFPNSTYAACEDLIFSYRSKKFGKMIYLPSALIKFQENEMTTYNDPFIMKSAAYWRLYFVQTNRELSELGFLWSQFGRTIFALKSEWKVSKRLKREIVQVLLHCIFAVMRKKSALSLINSN